MHTLRQDIAYALRQMRQSPVFTLTAMLTLALGIGATTAIFSLIHSVMLKSLPVTDPASLYRIGDSGDCCVEGLAQENWGMFSYPFYLRLKESTPEFSELAAFQAGRWQFSVRRGENDRVAKPMFGEFISGNTSTFSTTCIHRTHISKSDDQPTAPPVAMLSYRAWQQVYGSDPSIIGLLLIFDGQPITIIGITPPGYFGKRCALIRPTFLFHSRAAFPRPEFSIASISCVAAGEDGSPGASATALPERLTSQLRVWLVTESGMPAQTG